MYLFEMLMKEACAEEKVARENKNMKIWIVVRQIPFSDFFLNSISLSFPVPSYLPIFVLLVHLPLFPGVVTGCYGQQGWSRQV